MSDISSLVTDNIDLWTSAIEKKSSSGRGSSKKISLHGIKKLRELILELAVRGKLAPQDPSDEPASVLLEKIQAEKEQLIKEKKIRKAKPLPSISEDDKPFKITKGWSWTRFNDVFDVRDGTHDSPKYESNGYPLVTSKNLYSGSLDLSNVKYINEKDYLKILERSKVDVGDILFAMIGSIGNPVLVENEPEFAIKNMALFKHYIKDLLPPRFLQIYLELSADKMKENAAGGVQSFVSLTFLRTYLFPLPPLAEQHRIVAKVDELMALCDQLEKETEDQIEAHQTLVKTLLNTLTESKDAEELSQNWQRLRDHFDTLFTTEDSIDELKQTILQLAVMGKLVPQDPNDEPASVLFEKIQAEKERRQKLPKDDPEYLKKQKALPPITEDEKPFDLPDGWEWVILDEICTISGGKRLPKGHSLQKEQTPHIYIRVSDMKNGTISNLDLHYLSDETFNQISKYTISSEDIYMTIVGATIGKCGLVPNEFNNMNLTENAAKVSPILTDKTFLYKCMDSPYLQSQFIDKTKKVGVEKMSLIRFKSSFFALPPLAEQHRIVTKVDELMAICDKLKSRLSESQQTQLHLADTIVEQSVRV